MLIISQDKKAIINLKNVTQIYINNNEITADFNNSIGGEEGGGYEDLGEYSTEEKAQKALIKIAEYYQTYGSETVCQMPQEEEI